GAGHRLPRDGVGHARAPARPVHLLGEARPGPARPPLALGLEGHQRLEHAESEWRKGMPWERLNDEKDRTIRFPGMPNIFWMPIMTRTEMLATGFRTPVGVKVLGPDLTEIGRIGRDIEGVLSTVPGTRSAFAERTTGGYYLDL